MGRRRLDVELVRRGLVGNRTEAHEAVRAGQVTIRGARATKTNTLVAEDEPLGLSGPAHPYVSRGGEKLAAGLDRFEVDPGDRDCLDAGASTGGFTDCLLQRGARHVLAVDVGYGKLAWELRNDPRVTVLERTNVRDLDPTALPYRPSLLAVDLSFLSLGTAIGPLVALAAAGAELVLLIKPQFEVGHEHVERGGVVRDPAGWRLAIQRAADACARAGAGALDLMASPVLGPAGNVEFLLLARMGVDARPLDVEDALARGRDVAAR